MPLDPKEIAADLRRVFHLASAALGRIEETGKLPQPPAGVRLSQLLGEHAEQQGEPLRVGPACLRALAADQEMVGRVLYRGRGDRLARALVREIADTPSPGSSAAGEQSEPAVRTWHDGDDAAPGRPSEIFSRMLLLAECEALPADPRLVSGGGDRRYAECFDDWVAIERVRNLLRHHGEVLDGLIEIECQDRESEAVIAPGAAR